MGWLSDYCLLLLRLDEIDMSFDVILHSEKNGVGEGIPGIPGIIDGVCLHLVWRRRILWAGWWPLKECRVGLNMCKGWSCKAKKGIDTLHLLVGKETLMLERLGMLGLHDVHRIPACLFKEEGNER